MTFASWKATSGNSSSNGIGVSLLSAMPTAAVIQPALRPITSSTKTLVDVFAIDATWNAASRIEVATYLATEPKPGQLSVMGRSLSTVLGTCTAISGYAIFSAICDTLRQVAAGS